MIRSAVLINLLNPKLTIFFFAFLPQFLPNGSPHTLARLLGLSALFMLMTFVVFAAYGAFAASVPTQLIDRPRIAHRAAGHPRTVSLTLLDWRRRTATAYASYRGAATPQAGWELWREQRGALLAQHPDSALPAGAQVPYAPYDPALRFEVEADPDVEPVRLEITTGTDGVAPFTRIGVLRLPEIGTLDMWWLGSYGGGLFVPVKDATAGRTTYGGGRYLLDTVKGADHGGDVDPSTGRGALVVDFNLAYHPSCAYDPAWACPLAPAGNVLTAAVDAGELLPPGGWYRDGSSAGALAVREPAVVSRRADNAALLGRLPDLDVTTADILDGLDATRTTR